MSNKVYSLAVPIIVALIGCAGVIAAAFIENKPEPAQSVTTQRWQSTGLASTGEMLAVDNESISVENGRVVFKYRIGNETIFAKADCNNNEWYTEEYGSYSPKSEATQRMMNYVCRF